MFSLGEELCQEEQNLRTRPVLSTTAGSPGEPEEAAGSRRDAAVQEKLVANEATEQWRPGLHVGLLLWSFPASGCTRGPSCPWLPNHTGAIGWNQIPLCLPHLRWVEAFDLREKGPCRPAGKGNTSAPEDAVCRSSRRLEPGAHLLPSCRARAALYAPAAGVWKGSAESLAVDLTWLLDVQENGLAHSEPPHISHFSKWKWILWDCPFCSPYTAELDLLDSMYMSWKTHLLMCWKSDAPRT